MNRWSDANERLLSEGLSGLIEGDMEALLAHEMKRSGRKGDLVNGEDLDCLVEWSETVLEDHALLLAVLDGALEIGWDHEADVPRFRKPRSRF